MPATYEGFNVFEGHDSSGNKDKWDTYYRNYYFWDKQKDREERIRHERREERTKGKKKEEEKTEEIDSSLVYMGLGVATLGAAVILVMSLRK